MPKMLYLIPALFFNGCLNRGSALQAEAQKQSAAQCEADRQDLMSNMAFRDHEIDRLKAENETLKAYLTRPAADK